jgi:hypothetical protein
MNKQQGGRTNTVIIGAGVAAVAAVAGVALMRACSGHCTGGWDDDAPGRTARRSFGSKSVDGRTVTIGRSRAEVEAALKDAGLLMRAMPELVAFAPQGEGRYALDFDFGGGSQRLVAEIVRAEPGRFLAWQSCEGSDFDAQGKFEFADAPGNRGTRVTAIVVTTPGTFGRVKAKLTRTDPETLMRHALKRFRMLLETGEIAIAARSPALAAKEA